MVSLTVFTVKTAGASRDSRTSSVGQKQRRVRWLGGLGFRQARLWIARLARPVATDFPHNRGKNQFDNMMRLLCPQRADRALGTAPWPVRTWLGGENSPAAFFPRSAYYLYCASSVLRHAAAEYFLCQGGRPFSWLQSAAQRG
jgi:hypothetical protein